MIVAIGKGQKIDEELTRSNCEVAAHMARRLGLGTGVQGGLNEIYERWDGKGYPRKLSGDDLASALRPGRKSGGALRRLGGPELAVEVLGRRAGTALDPFIAEAFVRCGRELTEIASSDASVAVIEAEPEPCRRVSEPDLDQVARAFADMVDLKSPFTHGHSGCGEARRGCRSQSRPRTERSG